MTSSLHRPIAWTFIAPSLSRPAGGLVALFKIADELAHRQGADVRIVHVPTSEACNSSLRDLAWFQFDSAIEHHFATDLDPEVVPDADVVVFAPMLVAVALSPDAAPNGRQLIDTLQKSQGRLGVPILFLQGLSVFPADVEEAAIGMPGPKVCVGSWLADVLVRRGVAPARVHHISNGVDHRMFRVVRPIERRPPRVAMNFDPHPVKGGETGMNALAILHEARGTPSIAFGTRQPRRAPGPGTTFALSPDQPTLAKDIYNASTVYLQPSVREGFGMCAVEAMACGCALVTTANGGSADYAFDGETALVCGPDADEIADALVRLVLDDELRVRIAANGCRFVERFRWELSAERLARVASDVLGR